MKAKVQAIPPLPWNSYVHGIQVNDEWVKLTPGDYYLPIRLSGNRVMWKVSAAEIGHQAAAGGRVDAEDAVCLRVLAPVPTDGDAYLLKADFLESWQQARRLDPVEDLSQNQRKILNRSGKWIFSAHIRASEVSQKVPLFKMALHAKTGVWNQISNLFYTKLVWEWDGTNNRTLRHVYQASTQYLVYGKPELQALDVEEILKIALAADVSQDMAAANSLVTEVTNGISNVSCERPSHSPEGWKVEKCLAKALAQILSVCHSPKPSNAYLLWAAKLELDSKGDLSQFDRGLCKELIQIIVESASAPDWELGWYVVLEQAHSHRPDASWLQAAAQVLLRSPADLSGWEDDVLRCAQNHRSGRIDWVTISSVRVSCRKTWASH